MFSGLSGSLNLLFGLEFICSQAPTEMRGLLTGLYWFVRHLYVDIGALFALIHFKDLYRVSFGFWILVVQLAICVCGLVVFNSLVRQWYTDRKRDDNYIIQAHVENVFDRELFLRAEITQANYRLHYNSFNDS